MRQAKPKPRKKSEHAALIEDFCGTEMAVSWAPVDKRNLANFLATQTGERFAHILRNIAMRNTQMCVWNKGVSPDYARGQQQLFGEILNLSAISPLQLAESSGRVSLTDNENEQPEPGQQTEEPSDQLYGYGGSSIGY